jgi:hypothetical protein
MMSFLRPRRQYHLVTSPRLNPAVVVVSPVAIIEARLTVGDVSTLGYGMFPGRFCAPSWTNGIKFFCYMRFLRACDGENIVWK